METASLELCKKLWELSRWKTDTWWNYVSGNDHYQLGPAKIGVTDVPAYSLGYLIRKLASEQSKYNTKLYYSTALLNWRCQYTGYDHGQAADTPENACALLCMKLIEEGLS